MDYSFVTNKKNKQTLFACVCVLVERRFRILQITKIYPESVFVNKRALERVRVRRDCDDVSRMRNLVSFFSSSKSKTKTQPTPQKVKKVKKQAAVADFEARSKKKRDETREMKEERTKSRYRKTTIIKRIKTTESMLKKVDVSTRIAPVLSSF